MIKFKKKLVTFDIKRIQTDLPCVKIGSSKDAAEYARNFYGNDIDIFESMFILLLNNSNNTIAYQKISQGGITGTIVDIRLILKYAVEALATGVILLHNHPSGTLKPSECDKNLTNKTKNALDQMDIKLLDHLIITKEAYYSFADENLL